MSNEMVERVAKAILKAGDSTDGWDDIGDFWQQVYRKEARAAIEAMREPTDEMCEAADWQQQSEVNAYQRAIDEALK